MGGEGIGSVVLVVIYILFWCFFNKILWWFMYNDSDYLHGKQAENVDERGAVREKQ